MTEPNAILEQALAQLSERLACMDHPRAAEVDHLLTLLRQSPALALRQLDSNAWWAGAGSLAAETMADNPGLPESEWALEVRAFRTLLIEIGEALQAKGAANPGIGSWLLAFNNWNASEV